jgi:hypothetical protein
MLQVFAAGGARGRAGAQPDIKVDLAITFDPASRNIVKVQGRSLNTGGAAGAAGFGAVVLRGVNLGGQQQGEDEEADEADPKQKPAVVGSFEDGLPVRAKKELEKSTVIEFTYTFSKHGEAVPGTLDARARHLLGLPSGR